MDLKVKHIYKPRLTKKNIKFQKINKTQKKLDIPKFKKHITHKINLGDLQELQFNYNHNIISIYKNNKIIKTFPKFKEIILSHHTIQNFHNVEKLLYHKKHNLINIEFPDCITLTNKRNIDFTIWNINKQFLKSQNIALMLIDKIPKKGYKYIYINNNIKEFYFPEKIQFISLGTNNTANSPYFLSKNYFINLEFIYQNEFLNSYWKIKDCHHLDKGYIYPVKQITKKPLFGLNIFSYHKYITDYTHIKKIDFL